MAFRSPLMLLASAALAASRVAAYAIVDTDALADLAGATEISNAAALAPAVNAAVADSISAVSSSVSSLSTIAVSTVPASAVSTVSASALAASVSASAASGMDGCVHFQVIHSTNVQHFDKRAVQLSLANRSDVAYYAKLNFGSPVQPQYVQLDTGSFELWINPTCSGLSTSDETFCEAVGNFDTSASSTFSSLNSGKTLRYGIGSANITYGMDNISLPGTNTVLSQVQFGVASSSVDEFSGILGIGYGINLTTRYPNFIDELFDQGVTKVKAFSLALGSKSEQEGVIVFGGVDTSKFAGTLAKLPIIPAKNSPDGVPRYWVNMTSMSLTAPSGTTKSYSNSTFQVFLDSGSTLTLLPTDIVASIAADFSAVGPTSDGFYTVDCSFASSDGTLNFAFAGVTIEVPYKELIRQSGSQCMLGLQASSSFALLGDTFMRSAYVVIDQTDNVVWMAPYTNCGSTPAALLTASSLSTLTGACSQTGNVDTSSGSTASSSAAAAAAATSATTASTATAATATAKTTAATASSAVAAGTTAATTTSAAHRTGRAAGLVLVVSLFAVALSSSWL